MAAIEINKLSNKIYDKDRAEMFAVEGNMFNRFMSGKAYNVDKVEAFFEEIALDATKLEEVVVTLENKIGEMKEEMRVASEMGVPIEEGQELAAAYAQLEEMVEEVERMKESHRQMLVETEEMCQAKRKKAMEEAESIRNQASLEAGIHLEQLNQAIAEKEMQLQQLDSLLGEKHLLINAVISQTVEKIGEQAESRMKEAVESIQNSVRTVQSKEKQSISY